MALLSFLHPNQLVFVDETRKHPRSLIRTYGRAVIGRKAVDIRDVGPGFQNITAMGVMCMDGIVDVGITRCNVDGPECWRLFGQHVVPHLGRWPGPRSVVVVDNAQLHHLDIIKDLIHAVGARILYLPSYSFDLMPIEHAFHQMKEYLRRHWGAAAFYDREVADAAIGEAFFSVTREQVHNYLRNAFVMV